MKRPNFLQKPFRYTNFGAVYWLIGINILIFTIMRVFEREIISQYLYVLMPMRPLLVIERGWVWTFVTYMFMHGDIRHILFNMFGLFIFGIHVEREMGSREFLLYYFVTGILAGVLSFAAYYFTRNYYVALIGASGALFAVQLAYAVMFPTSVIYIWGILPLRAPVMVLGYTALELIFSLSGGRGNVAHLTHLAGFAFGWFYFIIRFGVSPWRRLLGR
ncbi:MAG: rhomboid family intramembrane serine protease [Treponema sp.]|jgi:membrane associated rhomboid family serine protease|nr:rhomboid family intramembrane serine protease [Treponema sp.]